MEYLTGFFMNITEMMLMGDPVGFLFMKNALLAAVLVSIACGVVGTLVVVNRMTFIAGGVAHAAYGGLGAAVFLGLPPTAGTLPVTLLGAWLMGYVSGVNRERADTVVGALWAAGMAVGIILIDLTPGYHADLMNYLFGSIMVVSTQTLMVMAVLDAVILGSVFLFFKELLAVSYDEEFAAVNGIPVKIIRYLLLCLVAFTVVMLIQAVGLILVIALFTIPASIAELYSRNLRHLMIIATVSAMVITVTGIITSWYLNLSAGATIILVACFFFGGAYLVKKVSTRSGSTGQGR
jgi:zinc transport system permease protein